MMLKKVRIAVKLPLTIFALCSLAVGMMAYLATNAAYSILEDQGRARLNVTLHAQADSFSRQLDAMRTGVVSQSISPVTRQAATTWIGAFEALPGDKTEFLQTRYITENEHPVGQKQLLDFAKGRDAYNRAHRKFHPYYRSIMEKNGFADLYVMDGEGNVLFSVMKNSDFATNVRDEGRAADGFSRAYEAIVANESVEFAFQDFGDYAVDGAGFSAFMATPILASNGAIVGVFVARIEADALDMGPGGGDELGQTGTARLIGQDSRIRHATNSDLVPGDLYTASGADDPVTRALAGETGVATSATESGTVLAAFQPLEFHGAGWVVVAQQDTAELFADVATLQQSTLVQGGGVLLIAAIIALVLARNITSPLSSVGGAMDRVSRGDYQSEIPEADRRDEVGAIAKTLESFRQSLHDGQAAEQRAALMGAALEATSANLMIVEHDLTIDHLNEATIALLESHYGGESGFDARALEGCSLASFCAEHARIADMLSGQTTDTTLDIQRGNARLTLAVQPVQDADGTCHSAVIEWQDKTQEFRRSALVGSIAQTQCLLEFDLAGHVTDANRNFLAATGKETAAMHGLKIEDLIVVDPGKLKHPDGFLAGLMQEKTAWGQFNFASSLPDPVFIEGGFSVVADDSGAPLSIVFIGNDVTRSRATIEAAEARRKAVERSQSKVVSELGAGLARLSDGDLTVQITTQFEGQYESLRTDFNSAVDSLLQTMQGLINSTEMIQQRSENMSDSADNILERTNAQANTLAETATDLSQLADSVSSAADRAQTTRGIVVDTRDNAIASGKVVKDAITAMGEIETSSQTIASITKVIEDIAFQTNLLALNAGVEAARAGEAGRGFAVVASEVRALAQRSSDAAREINQVISEANTHIDRGVKLVGGAGDALGEIFESIKGIADNVEEIANSAVSQSDGLREINRSVGEIDQVTRKNASILSETTTAGHALKQEATALSQANARFNTRADAAQTPVAPARPEAPQVRDVAAMAAGSDVQPASMKDWETELGRAP